MKVTLEQINGGTDEIIIRYRQMTERIDGIVKYLEGQSAKLYVFKEGQQVAINICDVIYLESVDGATFLYMENEIYRVKLTLAMFETLYAGDGFFRCSKAMVLNIYRIRRLKSMSGSRIDATMDNGEHIIISRRYAKELRNILRKEWE